MTLWLGRDPIGGDFLLHDPSVQEPKSKTVRLFSLTFRDWRDLSQEALGRLERLNNPAQILAVQEVYKVWSAQKLIESEARGAQVLRKQRDILERHKRRLERLQIDYRGSRTRSEDKRRITHCYDCSKPLDSDLESECIRCGWLICQCSACGCGYKY